MSGLFSELLDVSVTDVYFVYVCTSSLPYKGPKRCQLEKSIYSYFMICMTWYDLAHGAGWDPYNPHDMAHVSWIGICTKQILPIS